MNKVHLKEIAVISSGQGAPQGEKYFTNEGHPFIRAGSLELLLNGNNEDSLEKVNDETANKYKLRLYPEGTILFAKSGMSSTKDRVYMIKKACYVVNHLATIIPSKKIDSAFLTYWLRLFRPSRLIKDKSYPSIRLSDIEEVQIPLPPLPTQRKIASILEKAESAREKRREANRLTDEFLKSAFLEMFGDPAGNPKKWKNGIINDAIQFSEYGTSVKSTNKENGYPILGMVNITYDGGLDLTKLSYVELSESEFNKIKLQLGDVIFNRTNSTELVGKTTYWNQKFDAVIASYLVKLRLNKNFNHIWFSYLLNTKYYKHIFMKRCKKAVGQSNISPTLLKQFPIYIPPLSEQQKFADLVRKVEKLKEKQSESENELNNLFNSLMQRAFRRELV